MPISKNIDLRRTLRGISLFADIAGDHLDELAGTSRCVLFQSNQGIYRVGDPARTLFIVLSGQVSLTLPFEPGRERIVDVIAPGRTFGEAELFDTRPYLAGASAVRTSLILCIGRRSFLDVMALDARIALRTMTIISHRQIALEAEAAASHHCSTGQRLLDYFMSLADPPRNLPGEITVTLPMSKQALASRLQMRPESLSRTLQSLVRSGLVSAQGRNIRMITAQVAAYLADKASSQPIILPDRLALARARDHHDAAIADFMGGGGGSRRYRAFGDSINQAGRQRMLSQRMAKCWLMLEHRVLPVRAQRTLKQSMDMFEFQLRKLEQGENDAAISPAVAELGEAWKPYRHLLQSHPSRKGARQLFSLDEKVLSAAHKLTDRFESADGTPHGKLVNLAGRQRMLSQRVAKFFIFRHAGIRSPKCRAELEESKEEFSTALSVLASLTVAKPDIKAELETIAEHWERMKSAMTMRDGADFARAAGNVFATSEILLQRLNKAVELYVRSTD